MNSLTRAIKSLTSRSRVALLSALAGAPIGLRSPRRGTVLVLILGALALISVVTLVYVILGRGDSRNSAVVTEKSQVDTAVKNVADHIASVIADGTLAVFADGPLDPSAATAGSPANLVRKQWDYPFTDPFRRSVLNTSTQSQARRFNPTGSYTELVTGSDQPQPSEPWLATSFPSELFPATAPPRRFDAAQDWEGISNFSPDGRFVNLYNLAPRDPRDSTNLGIKRLSGFDALSINPVNNSSGSTPQSPRINGGTLEVEMGWGLTLNDPANGRPYKAGTTQKLPTGQNADYNVPAHWTMWQSRAVKLAGTDPYYGPGDPEYLPYQWCDTDGDGFYDTRWSALEDVSNPLSPVSLLPNDDRFRWFVAIRAIDLSSMVNVNTAADLRRPAKEINTTQGSRQGLYPEVDLLRLLRLDDIYAMYPGGYNLLLPNNFQYSYPTDDYSAYDLTVARSAGEGAYNAIRQALRPDGAAIPSRSTLLKTLATDPRLAALSADERVRLYQEIGGQTYADYFTTPAKTLRFSGRFGVSDLNELLTRRTINDPATVSRLEEATEGRYITGFPGGNLNVTPRYGPLRGIRSLRADGQSNDIDGSNFEGNCVADDHAWARLVADIRQFLTTNNGGRPLLSKPVTAANASSLAQTDLATDAYDVVRKITVDDPTGTGAGRDPGPLFKAYADALLPGSERPGYWDPATNYPIFRTTSFAYTPELALRIAGFLTANFGDLADGNTGAGGIVDNKPSAYTLLIDSSYANITNTAGYPWWANNSGKLDLGVAKLPSSPTGLSSNAINIYGIEAQPFLTQVVSMYIYTDAPHGAVPAGDDEFANVIPNGPEVEITIRGGIPTPGAPRTSDFLGQVLAFQLTNPFDVPIPLTKRDTLTNHAPASIQNCSEFYIEYAGSFYMMVQDATQPESIVLQAGETRNFYVLSNTITDMQNHWDSVGPPSGGGQTVSTVENFLDSQLALPQTPGIAYDRSRDITSVGNRVKPVRIKLMDPTTGQAIAQVPGVTRDLLNPPNVNSTDPEFHKKVLLWRNLEATGASGIDRSRHMLADRLHDPSTGRATLDRHRDAATARREINGTTTGPELVPIDGQVPAGNDNTGYTIALWGSIRRRDDPNGGVSTTDPRPAIGGLPAYCLEDKWAVLHRNDPAYLLKNIAETDKLNPDSLDRNDFTSGDNAEVSFWRFLDKFATVSGTASTPGDYTGVIIRKNNGGTSAGTITARADQRSRDKIRNNLNTGNPKPYTDLYPQVALQNNQFLETLAGTPPTTISTLRITDMLLPLGIGPCQDFGLNPTIPNPFPPGTTFSDSTAMTLSEAVALALNYSNPPATGDPFSIYYHIGDHSTGVPSTREPLSAGALTRGNLTLDKFVPFLDANKSNTFDTGEHIVFPGVPMALNILSAFRTLDPQFGSLTKATPGLININTAPLRVLRLLSLLSPTTDTDTLAGAGGPAYTRFNTDSGATLNDGHLPAATADAANGLFAYREKAPSLARDNLTVDTFIDTTFDPFLTNPGNLKDGRALSTGLAFTREQPGFAIPGEILNVAYRGPTPTTSTRLSVANRIDALAYDNQKAGTAGTSSILFKSTANLSNANAKPTVPDEVTDDYTERLLLASGVMNSVSVRSDVFAVWFVIHGYQRSDTENLGATDPLVPTIAKRFVMVIDRSNVTRLGEKPKILLFTELPM